MPFKYIPEMPDSGSYRPGCCIAQGANRISFNLSLYIPKQIYVLHLPFSIFNLTEYFLHPSCSFTARRTLTAAFMMVKPCERQCMANHTLVFIQNYKTTRTHHTPGRKA